MFLKKHTKTNNLERLLSLEIVKPIVMEDAPHNLAKLSPAAEAYLWGYPLVATHRTRLHLCSRHRSGELNHVEELATPADKAIVAPNNDTPYTLSLIHI